MRRGRLNLHDGPGGTLTAVLEDLETLWSSAIHTHLDIPIKDLKVTSMVLFLYVRSHMYSLK